MVTHILAVWFELQTLYKCRNKSRYLDDSLTTVAKTMKLMAVTRAVDRVLTSEHFVLIIKVIIMIMQIYYVPVSEVESEALVWAASRGMGQRKTGNMLISLGMACVLSYYI